MVERGLPGQGLQLTQGISKAETSLNLVHGALGNGLPFRIMPPSGSSKWVPSLIGSSRPQL